MPNLVAGKCYRIQHKLDVVMWIAVGVLLSASKDKYSFFLYEVLSGKKDKTSTGNNAWHCELYEDDLSLFTFENIQEI